MLWHISLWKWKCRLQTGIGLARRWLLDILTTLAEWRLLCCFLLVHGCLLRWTGWWSGNSSYRFGRWNRSRLLALKLACFLRFRRFLLFFELCFLVHLLVIYLRLMLLKCFLVDFDVVFYCRLQVIFVFLFLLSFQKFFNVILSLRLLKLFLPHHLHLFFEWWLLLFLAFYC